MADQTDDETPETAEPAAEQTPATEAAGSEPVQDDATVDAGASDAEQAPEAAAEESAAPEAAAPPAEPVVQLPPKERRRNARSKHSGEVRPSRTPRSAMPRGWSSAKPRPSAAAPDACRNAPRPLSVVPLHPLPRHSHLCTRPSRGPVGCARASSSPTRLTRRSPSASTSHAATAATRRSCAARAPCTHTTRTTTRTRATLSG
jgi:hypothetical protein